eukprot:scaffold3821_cov127-Cylindrotheca_fusiformis.AAC.4
MFNFRRHSEQIGRSAFEYCTELKFFQFYSKDAPPLETLSGNNANSNLEEGTIVFPNKAKLQIEEDAFACCNSLRNVIVCSVSTSFGKSVFNACDSLFLVDLPDGLQSIYPCLFYCCRSLTTVKIPSSVILIGQYAFSGCHGLTSVDLPHGLLHIGERSFEGCYSIETVHIPSTVSTIQRCAFYGCGLKNIKLPPNLMRIEKNMLRGCYRLDYIDLPSTITFIGEHAFYRCESLTHVRIPPSVETIVPNTFVGCSSLFSVELPEDILIGNAVDVADDESEDFNYDHFQDATANIVVNLAIPTLPEDDEVAAGLLYNYSRLLGADLNRKLKHRFDDSPLNKLCYYQSYHSSEDAMAELRRLMEKDPSAATSQVDEFGMTPLHVLSLSQTPNLDMLLAVMNAGKPGHMVRSRDSFGFIPMYYLSLNRSPAATEVIRRVLRTHFVQVLGLDQFWKSDMLQAIEATLGVNWRQRLEIGKLVRTFERKEILSLLELCLWKIQIDKFSANGQTADREFCRIHSGASIVIPHVLHFLNDLDMVAYFDSF